jgi:hypothetical protein
VIDLPSEIWSHYRLAADREIRGWSFGALTAARVPDASSWEAMRGTLDDQSIFGPVKDFECVCGKYRGFKYKGMICDRCRVKATDTECRRTRFGHVELASPVGPPLGSRTDTLKALPILPAAYFQSPGGTRLAELYDALVAANGALELGRVERIEWQICDLLAPMMIQAHLWNIHAADTFAHGMALERKGAGAWDDARCDRCGYPLEGLGAVDCPSCGMPIDNSS